MPRGRSLFVDLALAFAGVIVVAFAVQALATLVPVRRNLESLVSENLAYRNDAAAARLRRRFEARADQLEAWASSGVMIDVLTADRALRIENTLLRLVREPGTPWTRVTVTDAEGTIVASSNPTAIGSRLDFRALGVDPDPARGLQTGPAPGSGCDGTGEIVLARPLASPIPRTPLGWLVAHLAWRDVHEVVAGDESSTPGDRSRALSLLLDDRRRPIAGCRESLSLSQDALPFPAGEPAVVRLGDVAFLYRETTLEGVAIDDRVPRVATLWPYRDATGAVRLFVSRLLTASGLGIVLALVASLVLARMITRRLSELVTGTEVLASGDLAHRVPEGRPDEVGRLARSFNEMAGRLVAVQRELQRGKAQWQAVVAQAPDLIMTLDPEGRITFSNRGFAGVEAGELTGRTLAEVLPARSRLVVATALERVVNNCDVVAFELEYRDRSDASRWFAMRVGPIRDESGLVAVALVGADVTERKRLERELLVAAEEERSRIGQDLHDGLGQILTGAALLGERLVREQQRGHAIEPADLSQIVTLVNDAIRQVRRVARGLHPVGIETGGLRAALDDLAESLSRATGCRCRVVGDDPAQIDALTSTHLFRIVQEASNNALRHGGAKEITVRITWREDRRGLVVHDDGSGFDPERVGRGGLGLNLMRRRAEAIGATLQIDSRPGEGTTVGCWL